jgi:hypothetical protein
MLVTELSKFIKSTVKSQSEMQEAYKDLGFTPGQKITNGNVRKAFIQKSRIHHPNRGGTHAAQTRIEQARTKILQSMPPNKHNNIHNNTKAMDANIIRRKKE